MLSGLNKSYVGLLLFSHRVLIRHRSEPRCNYQRTFLAFWAALAGNGDDLVSLLTYRNVTEYLATLFLAADTPACFTRVGIRHVVPFIVLVTVFIHASGLWYKHITQLVNEG